MTKDELWKVLPDVSCLKISWRLLVRCMISVLMHSFLTVRCIYPWRWRSVTGLPLTLKIVVRRSFSEMMSVPISLLQVMSDRHCGSRYCMP